MARCYSDSGNAPPGLGRIVNISSIAGKVGFPFNTAYCAAKHGLIGLTRALAAEVADRGVTVNAVCPGYVETGLLDQIFAQRSRLTGADADAIRRATLERVPQRVILSPKDIVPAVLFLASDAAGHTTGEALNVSGGMVMH